MPQIRGTLFLSHSSEDADLTNKFGQLLKSLSLGQIDIWYSSDGETTGGIRPGDIWFEKVREKMQVSSSIIALVTPRSANSKWVLFESGAGAALDNNKLIVVTHGIESITDLPGPLVFWQAHRIDKGDSLSEFCKKLFAKYDIEFNEILFSSYLPDFFKSTSQTKSFQSEPNKAAPNPGATEIVNRLVEHFDRRFFEIATELNVKSQYITYNILVESEFDGNTYQIEISEQMSIQDVLDEIYASVADFVKVYRYLQTWILVHNDSGLKLVIREIAPEIPAQIIFKPGAHWIAQRLSAPYRPTDSKPESWSARRKINK